MCGHVGIAGNLEYKDEATMKRLLMYDYFRGQDSTGLAAIRDNGDVHISKIASHPIDLFDTEKFKKTLSGHASRVFMGHNRAATKGVVNGVNAHPFQFDHIIGAHNGTLEDASWNKLAEVAGEKFGVDSQNIIHAISVLGIEETMKHMNGAWSLVWVDMKEGSLNFLRNDKRPMWFAYEDNFKRMFWASEWPMIRAALELSAQSYELYKANGGFRFFESAVDVWYRYDLEQLKQGGTARPKAKVKELKGEGPAGITYTARTTPFPAMTSASTTAATTHSTTKSYSRTSNVLNLFGHKDDPFSGHISLEKFSELTKYGCAWCHKKIDSKVKGMVYIEQEEKIVGSCCSGTAINTVYVPDLDKVVNK